MKKNLFICILIAGALILSNCSKKDDTTTTKTNTNTTGKTSYKASGAITYTAGGVNYSLAPDSVVKETDNLVIYGFNLTPYASVIINVLSATAISTGTFTIPNAILTFSDNSYNTYQASVLYTSSTCTINITALSSTSVKGTFTATAALVYGTGAAATVGVTNGVINCTLSTK